MTAASYIPHYLNAKPIPGSSRSRLPAIRIAERTRSGFPRPAGVPAEKRLPVLERFLSSLGYHLSHDAGRLLGFLLPRLMDQMPATELRRMAERLDRAATIRGLLSCGRLAREVTVVDLPADWFDRLPQTSEARMTEDLLRCLADLDGLTMSIPADVIDGNGDGSLSRREICLRLLAAYDQARTSFLRELKSEIAV